MKNNKIKTTLIALLFVFSAAVVFFPNISAEPPIHTVRGKVYINDIAASMGEGTEVKLEFADESYTSEIVDLDGSYNIGFYGHNYETGELSVIYQNTHFTPDSDGEIYITAVTSYFKDIYITIDIPLDNHAPLEPNSEIPEDNSEYIVLNPTLSWNCTDPDGDDITYDIYFGNSSEQVLIESDDPTNSYEINSLDYDTTYYWKIIARDIYGVGTEGPVWMFETRNEPVAPNMPNNEVPENGSTGVSKNIDLSFNATDNNIYDTLRYDIYFGESDDPDLVEPDFNYSNYDPGTLDYNTTYYWKVVVKDQDNRKTESPVWHFKTSKENLKPEKPSFPNPLNNSTGIDIDTELFWAGEDQDGDPVHYYFYFGTTKNPSYKFNTTNNSITLDYDLEYNTSYFWKIVTVDSEDASTEGDLWQFKTKKSDYPVALFTISGTKKTGETLSFNASESYDSNDQDLMYRWKFSESDSYKNWSDSKVITYSYSNADTYNVTLQIKDTDDKKDSLVKTITITNPTTSNENRKPNCPSLIDPYEFGESGVDIDFKIKAIDPDGDRVKFEINWNDGNSEDTGFVDSDETLIITHSFPEYGEYNLEFTAVDENGKKSSVREHSIFIDMVKVGYIGYLIDNDGDGRFDIYKSITGDESDDVCEKSSGLYLIDADGDGKSNYKYDDNTKTYEEHVETMPNSEEEEGGFPLIYLVLIIIIIAVVVSVVLFFFLKKRSPKPMVAGGAPVNYPEPQEENEESFEEDADFWNMEEEVPVKDDKEEWGEWE